MYRKHGRVGNHEQVHRHFGLRGVRPFSGLNINRSIVNVSTLRRRNAAVTCVSRAGNKLLIRPVLGARNSYPKFFFGLGRRFVDAMVGCFSQGT